MRGKSLILFIKIYVKFADDIIELFGEVF